MMRNQVVAVAFAAVLLATAGCAEFDPGDGYDFPTEPIVVNVPTKPELNLEESYHLKMPSRERTEPSTPSQILVIPEGGRLEVPPLRLDSLGHNFTLELWLRFDDDLDQLAMSTPGLQLWQRNRTLHLDILDTNLAGMPLNSPEWYHVAVVVRHDEVRLYVNGHLTDRENIGVAWTWSEEAPLTVGQRPNNAQTFRGRVENMRLVAAPLYEQPFFDAPTSIVGADHAVFGYDFDVQDAGEIIVDIAGRGVNATLHAGAHTVNGSI